MAVTITGRNAATKDIQYTGTIQALIDSEDDLTDDALEEAPPGSVAYSADGSIFKLKNNAGEWIDWGVYEEGES